MRMTQHESVEAFGIAWLDKIQFKEDMSAEVDAVFDDTDQFIYELQEKHAYKKHP